MKYYTINIFNDSLKAKLDKPMLVFKQRHHACNMIKGWFRTHTQHMLQHVFEIRQIQYAQLPTNRNILLINEVSHKTIDEYYPFTPINMKGHRNVLEEDTWKSL